MSGFIVRRLLRSILVLLGVITLVFVMVHLAPGDPARLQLGMYAPPSAIAAQQHALGLDRPLLAQYGIYVGDILTGNLGQSIFTEVPVITTIGRRAPVTIELAFLAVLVASGVAVVLGAAAGWRRGSRFDGAVRTGTVIGLSLPNFWLGLILILIFGLYLPNILPPSGWVSFADDPVQNLYHAVLPVFVLALPLIAMIARTLRVAMLDTVNRDYVIFGRAMGLTERRVMSSIALPNAIIPTSTVIGISVGYLIGGAVIVEKVFTIPGIGQLTVNAFLQKDYPVAIGGTLFIAFFFVGANFVVDVLYAYMNPKIRDLYLRRRGVTNA
jgi:peptide/nickel transport system permease protein